MKVHVFTITYNEEIKLPFFIKHYRERFPDCKITIFDNESTDKTIDIAAENNCEVFIYNTNNEIRDDAYLKIKERCWKESNADWIFVVDCDEFVDVTEEQLSQDFNIIKTEGWDMIGNDNNIDNITDGVRSPGYDKVCAWKSDCLDIIQYQPGCHEAMVVAKPGITLVFNSQSIKMWHFKWISLPFVLERHKLFNKRLSQINKENKWGIHYGFSEEQQTKQYNEFYKHKTKVR